MLERTVLRSISDGNVEFQKLVDDLALHPRMIAECLTGLFEAGIIEFRHGAAAFFITAMGTEALADSQFVPPTLQCDRKAYWIVVERITGLAEVSSSVTFERTDELRSRGITILPPSDIDPTPGRSTVRRLVERRLRPGEWLRSIGKPEPVFRYNSSVQIDVHDGRVERLRPGDWVRALTVVLREQFDLGPPDAIDPAIPWVKVEPEEIRAISGGAAHAHALETALEQSTRFVFIHSAFL